MAAGLTGGIGQGKVGKTDIYIYTLYVFHFITMGFILQSTVAQNITRHLGIRVIDSDKVCDDTPGE